METEVPNDLFRFPSSILVDNSIERKEYKTFIPQSKADFNGAGSTIEIDIPATDAYYVPSKSYIKIKGRLVRNDNDQAYTANDQITLINNAIMYLFSNIEYSLGGKKMETINFPGHTTSMLGYLSYPDDFNSSAGQKQCWRKDTNINATSAKYQATPAVDAGGAIAAGRFTPRENPDYNEGFANRKSLIMTGDGPGRFAFNIPFSHIFGFAEYEKVLYSLQHILKFTRAADTLSIHRANGVTDGKIILHDIQWVIPKVTPSSVMRMELMEVVKNKSVIPINFCGRNDQSTTVTRDVRDFQWMINQSAGIEKPRWIIVGFQTNKIRSQEQNPAVFDHVNLTSAFVELNGDRYPSNDKIINFAENDYVDFYEMTDEFKREYYQINNLIGGTQIDLVNFKKLFPILVFDVRHQSEVVKSNVMSIKLNFKFSENIPEHTHIYGIIISDRVAKLTSDGHSPMIVQY